MNEFDLYGVIYISNREPDSIDRILPRKMISNELNLNHHIVLI